MKGVAMMKGTYRDKAIVVDILTKSFDSNQSVNYIVKQDKRRIMRIRRLMQYSFEICYLYGEIFLSPDKRACALVVNSERRKTTLKSILLDVQLAWSCISISNIKRALNRESKIKKCHPREPIYYLWFIGVDPEYQNQKIGSGLLESIIEECTHKHRPIYLETSTPKNIPWYEKAGFKVYRELDFGYKLFLLKRELC